VRMAVLRARENLTNEQAEARINQPANASFDIS